MSKKIWIWSLIIVVILLVGWYLYFPNSFIYLNIKTPNQSVQLPNYPLETTNQIDPKFREEIISGLFNSKSLYESGGVKSARNSFGLANRSDVTDEDIQVRIAGALKSKTTADNIRALNTTWFFQENNSAVTIVVHTGADVVNSGGFIIHATKVDGLWVWD